jgi:uncharacterized metal-binding protein
MMAGTVIRFLARPRPVLYACAGCAEFGYAAPRVAQALQERGLVDAIWLGAVPARISDRYPILALDACQNACARDWIRAQGGRVDRAMVLEPLERDAPEAAAARIAAELSPT